MIQRKSYSTVSRFEHGKNLSGNCASNNATVIITIPRTVGTSGLSPFTKSQLRMLPVTGTRNFKCSVRYFHVGAVN